MTREHYEDPLPSDPAICGRFGSGAFPCGSVVTVRVTTHSGGPGRGDVTRRHALCEAHRVFQVTKTGVSGGASGFKNRAKTVAMQRLAGRYPTEFWDLYAAALTELCEQSNPPIDPTLLIGTGQ